MSDTRSLLARTMERVELRPFTLEGFHDRRDRKRRNQRIAAVVVAIAVFAAPVWVVATSGGSHRTIAPATTGSTDPTGPPHPTGVGLFGLPPEGATPSTPERGKLVVSIGFGHTSGDPGRFSLYVYEDGRVIWQRLDDPSTGLIEQRLTPKGVELVRADVVSTGLFDHDRAFVAASGLHYGGIEVRAGDRLVKLAWGNAGYEVGIDSIPTTPTPEQVSALEQLDARLEDLTSWLPASAWEDPELRAYVPSRYTVCYMGRAEPLGRSRILDLLPAPAADLLRSVDTTQSYVNGFRGSRPFWCSVVTTEQARELVAVIDPSRRHQEGLSFDYPPADGLVDIGLEPTLPHD